jgi:glucose/arabinose dehydrogenase
VTQLFSGLNFPTAVRFAPGGDPRVFVAEKTGVILEFDSTSDTTPTQVIDLRREVFNQYDRGLLGLAVDPEFPVRPYLYALYTRDAVPGGAAPAWGTGPDYEWDGCPQAVVDSGGCVVTGRLVKITIDPKTNTAIPDPPQVLLDGWCQQYTSHSIGDLHFGPEGALYASGGDGASYDVVDSGQAGNPCGDPLGEGGALRSQDLRTTGDPTGLDGTIARINPDTGAPWPGNPLAGPDDNARRVIADGLRNPFRFTFRPGTDEIFLGDVGWTTWEEVDRVPSPAAPLEDFGWPCYEGGTSDTGQQVSLPQPGYQAAALGICSGLYADPGAVTAPYWSLLHGTTVDTCSLSAGSAISGLAFTRGNAYPAPWADGLYVADYASQCIFFLPAGPDGKPDPAQAQWFVTSGGNPVDLQVMPGGDLVYADIGTAPGTGAIRRISWAGHTPPNVAIKADHTSGPVGMTVHFDGTGTTDPGGGALQYSWDLNGDGTFGDSTSPTPTFT